jgi:S1-C subfamily serine protease
MLAGEVTDVTEAGRVLPAAAVAHFVKLWTGRQTLARAVLGLKLSPAAGIPRVEECVAALPAERAGLQPGDVILRIGSLSVTDATAAAEACFYLRVDEPVTLSILRGTQTLDLTMTPVPAAGTRQTEKK